MTSLEYLTLVQRLTHTQPIIIDENYKAVYLMFAQQDHDRESIDELSPNFDKAIKELMKTELPTPYESLAHYPVFADILDNLILIGVKHDIIPPDFPKPLIGSADLMRIGAYAKTAYNTIIIDRGLYFFFSNMSRIMTELVSTNINSVYVIRPSVLTIEELKTRIQSNHDIIRDFTEIMASYLRYGTVIPFSRRSSFSSSEKSLFHNVLTISAMRFIIAHELMHVLYNHQQSTPQNESKADLMATQLCCLFEKDMGEKPYLYWTPVYVTCILDLLQQADSLLGNKATTHPEKRADSTYSLISKMNAGEHSLGMAVAVRQIVFLLWYLAKDASIGLAKDERITSPEMLKGVISAIHYY